MSDTFKFEVKCNDETPAFKRRQQAAKAAVRMAAGTLKSACFGLNRRERRMLKVTAKQTNRTTHQRATLGALGAKAKGLAAYRAEIAEAGQ